MIKHVLRDGTVLQSIKGHQISRADAPRVYEIMERIRKEKKNDLGRDKKGE